MSISISSFPLHLPSGTIVYATEIPAAERGQRSAAERQAVGRLVEQAFPGRRAVLDHRPSGEPFIQGSDLNISISHGAGLALLAVAPQSVRVGLDIECWREQLRRVAPRFLSPTEVTVYGAAPPTLLTAWTIKEAIFKAAGIPDLTISQIQLPPDINPNDTPGGAPATTQITAAIHHPAVKDLTLTLHRLASHPQAIAIVEGQC